MSEPTTAEVIERRWFTFLSWLTGLVVGAYVAASIYALIKNGLPWSDFSGAVGPIAGTLMGYWLRGDK